MEEQKTLEEVVTVEVKKRKSKERASKTPSKHHPKRKELFLEDGTVNYVNTVGGCYEETIEEAPKGNPTEPIRYISPEEEEVITQRTYEQLIRQMEEETDRDFYWHIFKIIILAVILLGIAVVV